LLVEVSGRGRLQRAFASPADVRNEVELSPGLFGISVDPERAMEEYLGIRMGALGRALGSVKPFQALMAATPGMREMQTMAKIWELAHPERPAGGGRPYDLVVVDAPATAYAIGLLRTPGTFAGLATAGPVAAGARTIATMLADDAFTGVVAVATGTEAAVGETLYLRDALADDGHNLSAVVLNRVNADHFTPDEVGELRAITVDAPASVRGAIQAAVSEHERAAAESAQAARLATELTVPVVTLPLLDAEGGDPFHRLAERLAGAWPAHVLNAQA
jgi:anion-transporting  ArsA/GET3 family ATPase